MGSTLAKFNSAALVAIFIMLMLVGAQQIDIIKSINSHDGLAATMFIELTNNQNSIMEKQEAMSESLTDIWPAVLVSQDTASYASNTAYKALARVVDATRYTHTHKGMK